MTDRLIVFNSNIGEFSPEILVEAKKVHTEILQKENLRLLYVALTRARDELYIVGSEVSNKPLLNKKDSWYNILKHAVNK